MSDIPRNLKDPESVKFWETVDRANQSVKKLVCSQGKGRDPYHEYKKSGDELLSAIKNAADAGISEDDIIRVVRKFFKEA